MMIWFPRSHDLPNPALSPTNAGHPAPQTGKNSHIFIFHVCPVFVKGVQNVFRKFRLFPGNPLKIYPQDTQNFDPSRANAPKRSMPIAARTFFGYTLSKDAADHAWEGFLCAGGWKFSNNSCARSRPPAWESVFFGLADCSKKSCALCRICRLWKRFLRPIIKL